MGSIKPMEMSLRNGKIKTKPIDSDDDYEPLLNSRYNSRIKQVPTIKIELDNTDSDSDYVDETFQPVPLAVDRVLRARQPKVEVSKQSDESDESIYSDEYDDVLPLDLNSKHNNMPNLTKKPLKPIGNGNKQNQKRQSTSQTAPAQIVATPTDDSEKRSYCCYLCSKTFQHLCRLHTHYVIHTNERRYSCTWCVKRYKSSSSLNAHIKQCHSDKPRKPRSKSSTKKSSKKAVNKSKISKCVVKILTIKLEPECEKFVEDKIEASDSKKNNEMDVSLELDPLEIHENVPFVWDKNDANLMMPMSLNLVDEKSLEMNKVEPKQVENIETPTVDDNLSSTKMECNDTDILKNENEEKPSILTTPLPRPKVQPSKLEIWQKEAADPLAMHVDILRTPKSKRILFPGNLKAPNKTSSVTHNSTTDTDSKNKILAEIFRAYGDNEFRMKNWADARQWYSRSLCYAEQKTYQFSTAYAKRAQCFFHERLYRTCWTDLMLSQSSGLPEVLLPQLERHKQSCKFMIKRQQMQANQQLPSMSTVPATSITVQPQLSFAANPLFPEMVSVLQIDSSETCGRYLCASQSIAVGQILIIETGFVANTTSFYEKCCICLTADTNLVPCSRCTRALLCKNCVHGWFHEIECELQMSLGLNEYPWLAKVVRSFLIAINLFENVDEMMKFVDDAISNSHTTPIVNQKSKYRAFLQLVAAPYIPPEMIPIIVKLHTTLLSHPAIRYKFNTTKYERFLAHLLMHHICVIDAFTMKVGSAVSENGFTEIVAPITSYLKHSCAPNVSKFLLGKTVIVVAMRPIEPGEQLCACYCDVSKATIDRQTFLQQQYGFQCQCERCQLKTVDQQIQTFHCDAAEAFVKENFVHLASTDQIKRKQLTDCVVEILQQFGRMPWNYTIGWAYVVFSLLLSHRFQKKLLY